VPRSISYNYELLAPASSLYSHGCGDITFEINSNDGKDIEKSFQMTTGGLSIREDVKPDTYEIQITAYEKIGTTYSRGPTICKPITIEVGCMVPKLASESIESRNFDVPMNINVNAYDEQVHDVSTLFEAQSDISYCPITYDIMTPNVHSLMYMKVVLLISRILP